MIYIMVLLFYVSMLTSTLINTCMLEIVLFWQRKGNQNSVSQWIIVRSDAGTVKYNSLNSENLRF